MPRFGKINPSFPLNRRDPLVNGMVSFWYAGLPGRGRGKLYDIGKNLSHGTLTNGPTWKGNCIAVAASASSYIAGTYTQPRISATNELSLLIHFSNALGDDSSTSRYLMSEHSSDAYRLQYHKRSGFGPSLAFQIRPGFGGPGPTTSSYTLAQYGRFVVGGTFRSGETNLYLDGLNVATSSTTFTLPADCSTWRIGSGWTGDIFSAIVWNRALSPAEMQRATMDAKRGYVELLNRRRIRRVTAEAAASSALLSRMHSEGLFVGGGY
jgi:hypothetical protein